MSDTGADVPASGRTGSPRPVGRAERACSASNREFRLSARSQNTNGSLSAASAAYSERRSKVRGPPGPTGRGGADGTSGRAPLFGAPSLSGPPPFGPAAWFGGTPSSWCGAGFGGTWPRPAAGPPSPARGPSGSAGTPDCSVPRETPPAEPKECRLGRPGCCGDVTTPPDPSSAPPRWTWAAALPWTGLSPGFPVPTCASMSPFPTRPGRGVRRSGHRARATGS